MTQPPGMRTGDHRQSALSNSVRIVIGEVLDIQSTTRNEGDTTICFTEGVHTYFQISDVANVQLVGLRLRRLDKRKPIVSSRRRD